MINKEELENYSLEELAQIREEVNGKIYTILDEYAKEFSRLFNELSVIPDLHMYIDKTYHNISVIPNQNIFFEIHR